MPTIRVTPNLHRHASCPDATVGGTTVAEALNEYFDCHSGLKSWVLDDQGSVRHHMVIFVNGVQISDPVSLSDHVGDDDELFVFQALSGG